ncbi:unnamed protein product [Prorocentrum cordatum]|uniref:NAD-dependent epimerase/dehydratase domain-containing protein n=1 Tax=Prorocentrum cordatum TaxID=2364126 RepID=A0ABN9SWE0_9DINO|nr:unnamed protein product [Polarella glacialis]
MSVLVIGAGGAVGKRLVRALASRGERVVAVDRAPALPDVLKGLVTHAETSADVRDFYTMQRIFKRHRLVHTVWNLAAPLSVETATNPRVAEQVTVNGMRNVLWAMYENRVRRIMFTDSIGSFGAAAPREQCTARWLTENAAQDPGSDYGRQKRGVRRLLHEFWRNGGDPRWAVLPGVLHSEATWGMGTTEYALGALLAAVKGEPFVCPVEPDERLPMIYVDDLMRGLLALQDAEESRLREPERGYAIPGFSFTARELFQEIRLHQPGFRFTVELDENMAAFARLWPNTPRGSPRPTSVTRPAWD